MVTASRIYIECMLVQQKIMRPKPNVFQRICRYHISHGRELTIGANARRTSWMSGGWVNLMTIAGPTQGTLFGDGWASFRIHQVCSSSIMLKIMLTFNCLKILGETSIAELHYHCSNCCSAPILLRTRLTIPLVAESSMFVLRPWHDVAHSTVEWKLIFGI